MPTEILREDVSRLVAGGTPLVEVLPMKEYEAEHIAGAISLPLKKLNQDTTAQFQRDQPIIVYCADYQ